ncbi:MAG: hypothetical protein LBQ36_03805 [Synergistaceae bacterium]|jgi:uncharacterized protein YukE|nr:hypothetical protein [Synergistaceae bacterium]
MAATTINVANVNEGIRKSLKEIASQEDSLKQVADVFASMEGAWESETQTVCSRKFRRSRAEIEAFNNALKEYYNTTKKCVDDCASVDANVGKMLSSVNYKTFGEARFFKFPSAPVPVSLGKKIRFDSEYMRSYSKDTVARAQELVEGAIELLKKANRHDGWRCQERYRINDDLSLLVKDLASFNSSALGGLSTALTKGADMFDEWERDVSAKESAISSQLKKTWAFEATVWNKDAGQKPLGPALPPRPPINPWPPIFRPLPVYPVPRPWPIIGPPEIGLPKYPFDVAYPMIEELLNR